MQVTILIVSVLGLIVGIWSLIVGRRRLAVAEAGVTILEENRSRATNPQLDIVADVDGRLTVSIRNRYGQPTLKLHGPLAVRSIAGRASTNPTTWTSAIKEGGNLEIGFSAVNVHQDLWRATGDSTTAVWFELENQKSNVVDLRPLIEADIAGRGNPFVKILFDQRGIDSFEKYMQTPPDPGENNSGLA